MNQPNSPDTVLVDMAELMKTEAAARYLSCNKRTLENWRSLGYGPRYIKLGKAVRYRRSDLIAYIEQHTHQHTGEMAVA